MARSRRWHHRLLRLTPLALVALALAACGGHPQTALITKGPAAHMELGLMGLSMWMMIGVFVVVAGLLIYAMIRFRERPGDTGLPPQIEGSHTLEIIWTVIPIILLVVLAIPSFTTDFTLAAVPPPQQSLQVTVVGHQWWWEFDYPDLGIVTADELHIPTGEKISLTLRSVDVLHSFWVPALAGKEDTVPGIDNTMWLQADQVGTYPGQCAEFCGDAHSAMRLLVVAQSPADFQTWVTARQHAAADSVPTSDLAKQGQKLFASDCATCHAADNSTPWSPTQLGPNLGGLSTKLTLAAGTLQNDDSDLRAWVKDAPSIMPGIVMPDFSTVLGPADLDAITAYLEGLQ